MKKIGFCVLGLGLALMTACSSDNDEPNIPKEEPKPEETAAEWSGKFEGQWNCWGVTSATGTMEVDGDLERENMGFIFPAEAIFDYFIQIIRSGAIDRPMRQKHLTDTIGNIFFADSYTYIKKGQYVSFKLNTASDGSYHASDIGLYTEWNDIYIYIYEDYEPPYPGETSVIVPVGKNTIAFGVVADGVTYIVTLDNKEEDMSLDFDASTGLWTFTYSLDAFRIFNLNTNKEYSMPISTSLDGAMKEYENKLQFKATQRTGPSDGFIINY